MRTILPLAVLIVVVVLSVADAQQYMPMYPPAPAQGSPARYAPPPPQPFSPYDRNYSGPMNMYGQPTFSVPQYGPVQRAQQQGQDGYVPMAVDGLYHLGSYLWSFMPAPLTGAKSPYDIPQGSGQVNVNFVPGTR